MSRLSTEPQQVVSVLRLLQKNKKLSNEKFALFISTLENEALTNGFDDNNINIIIDICKSVIINIPRKCSLIKCLVPAKRMPEKAVESILSWFFSCDIKIMLSLVIAQWLVGLLEHQLVDQKLINMYYDVFFYKMLKDPKLEKALSQLIYLLAKPQDVTRRDVTRLLNLHQKYSKPQKHIVGLLSLFKSYKPELVPEKIPTINLGAIWLPIPRILEKGLENAEQRCQTENQNSIEKPFKWNPLENVKRKKQAIPLVPSVGYFHMGSNAFKNEDLRPVFDITSEEELGKYHSNIELPTKAVSLLSNAAGYHLLAFADFQYQSRFSYNLFNTFSKAFKLENNHFSTEEIRKLLEMTGEFCDYMQQDIPVVNLFLSEYCLFNSIGYDKQFLQLFSWMITVPTSELQNKIFVYLRTTFLESSLEMKCEIIKAIKTLIINLFVDQGFESSQPDKTSSFLNRAPVNNIKDMHPLLTKFAETLIVTGLNTHSFNPIFLSEVLFFYEQISILELRSKVFFACTLPPPVVIHCGIITTSSATLSRVCNLLLRYYQVIIRNQELERLSYSEKLDQLFIYIHDIIDTLWNNDSFENRGRTYFLKDFSKYTDEKFINWNFESLLSIVNHYSMLPISTVTKPINENSLAMAMEQYYPSILKFYMTFYK